MFLGSQKYLLKRMNNLPDDLIKIIYSYLQVPKQFKFLNSIFFKEEVLYSTSHNLFKNLKKLNCSSNQLSSLPKCFNNLTKLYCFNNQLLSLPGNLKNRFSF